jgi:Arc/MetJ family transcription regulator
MRVTIDLPEADLKEICRITGISRRSTAIRKLVADTLLRHRRVEISGKFLSDEWSAELENFEAKRSVDRTKSRTLSELWRD